MYAHLVFYDGECGFCDRAVQFILQRDKKRLFCFAPLKGETALRQLQDRFKDIDSLILVENFCTQPKIYFEGEAVLRVCQGLPYPWKAFSFFSGLPSSVINGCYRWVARHRKLWIGEACIRPDSADSERFLK